MIIFTSIDMFHTVLDKAFNNTNFMEFNKKSW